VSTASVAGSVASITTGLSKVNEEIRIMSTAGTLTPGDRFLTVMRVRALDVPQRLFGLC
jgi:hypothetical protein